MQGVQALVGGEAQLEMSLHARRGGGIVQPVGICKGRDRLTDNLLKVGLASADFVLQFRFIQFRQVGMGLAVGSKFNPPQGPILNLLRGQAGAPLVTKRIVPEIAFPYAVCRNENRRGKTIAF